MLGFSLDVTSRVLEVAGVKTELDSTNCDILQRLVDRVGSTVPLCELLGLSPAVGSDNGLKRRMTALRRLLPADVLETNAGQGYRLVAVAPAAEPAVEAPARVPVADRGGLQLVGREKELAALLAQHHQHALVSIVGAGGVGKTSLAMAALATLKAGGARTYMVDLAPVSDAARILPLIASALAVNVSEGTVVAAVAKALEASSVVLLLDNCEHLLEAVRSAANTLLEVAPGMRIIATSQATLGALDECVYRLLPLEQPAAQALFEQRVRKHDPSFCVDARNEIAVGDICRALDGLPLAIELAAARVHLLGVDGVAARLGERLRLLAAGLPDHPQRQRSLRAALLWSHDLLAPERKTVFRRLGVFAGSFSMDAAQSVCVDAALDEWAVLDAVSVLVDRSLVVADGMAGGTPRFRLLETMRIFAVDQMIDADEHSALRELHLTYYLQYAQTAAPHLFSVEQAQWHARLYPDLENFLAAHRACDQVAGGAQKGLQLVNALERYWINRSAVLQGEQVSEEACARQGADAHPALLAHALYLCGRYHALRNREQAAIDKFAHALAIARPIGATRVVGSALARSGYAHFCLGNNAQARVEMEEANKISAALGDDELARVAPTLLAELERFEGHHAVARPLYAMVRQIAVKTEDLMGQMICLNNMGWTAVALNDHSAALECAEASLAIADQLDSRRGRWIVMEVCASVAADIGEHDTAARLDAAALVHTTQMGRYRDKADAALLDARIEIARTALGARAYNAAVDAGRALSQEDAIAEMRAWLAVHPPEGFVTGGTRHPTMSGAEPSAGIKGADSLTPREREVISLVARGYSNADIATLMEISVFTVRTHRQRLMQKLDLRNAAEITALAVQLGLYSPN